jgi:hypothetical protein
MDNTSLDYRIQCFSCLLSTGYLQNFTGRKTAPVFTSGLLVKDALIKLGISTGYNGALF